METIDERMRELLRLATRERGRFAELEQLTTIPAQTWRAFYSGRQRVTVAMIEAITELWPFYAAWLCTGRRALRMQQAPHAQAEQPVLYFHHVVGDAVYRLVILPREQLVIGVSSHVGRSADVGRRKAPGGDSLRGVARISIDVTKYGEFDVHTRGAPALASLALHFALQSAAVNAKQNEKFNCATRIDGDLQMFEALCKVYNIATIETPNDESSKLHTFGHVQNIKLDAWRYSLDDCSELSTRGIDWDGLRPLSWTHLLRAFDSGESFDHLFEAADAALARIEAHQAGAQLDGKLSRQA